MHNIFLLMTRMRESFNTKSHNKIRDYQILVKRFNSLVLIIVISYYLAIATFSEPINLAIC